MYISEPYFDAGGSEAEIVSVTVPFYTADGKFGGVAGADLSLDLIRAIVTSLRFRPDKQSNAKESSGTQDYSFLITRSGHIMAHPNEALSMSQHFAGADVRTVPGGNDIAAHDSGFARLLENGMARRVYWAKAPLTGWKVAMSIPEIEITGSASQLAVRTVVVAGLAVILLVLVVWVVARRLTEPVRRLTLAAEHVSQQRYETADELDSGGWTPRRTWSTGANFPQYGGRDRQPGDHAAQCRGETQAERAALPLVDRKHFRYHRFDRQAGTIQVRQSFHRADPGGGDRSGRRRAWAIF